MDYRQVCAKLVNFANEHKARWNEMDGVQGDGDLGITIQLSAQALYDSAADAESIAELLQRGGKAIRRAAPSTMGILIASSLIAAGKRMSLLQQPASLADWTDLQRCMIEEIERRGNAKLGDKTVLDAFIPAVQQFEAAVNEGATLQQALHEAAAAAKEGAEATASIVSRIGRSSWLGERSLGHIDGGAWVCYQIYEFLSKEV